MTLLYGVKTTIIPYVLTWGVIVTKFFELYRRILKILDHIEAYVHSLVLEKNLESISLKYRRARKF